jgi:hypothetical protein
MPAGASRDPVSGENPVSDENLIAETSGNGAGSVSR